MASSDEIKLFRAVLATQHYTLKAVSVLLSSANVDEGAKKDLFQQMGKALDNLEQGLSAMDAILGIDSTKDRDG